MQNDSSWYFRDASGKVSGPHPISVLLERVESGDIPPGGSVSADGSVWRPAVLFKELGFDCIVLQAEPSIRVLGPFTRGYLDRPDVTGPLPPDGLFFVRSGTIGEAALVPGSDVGKTGAALVERVLAAESAFREAEHKRREAEASLKAKDLEADAERKKLDAEISSLKAQVLKLEADAEGLRKDVARGVAAERRALEAEAKLVDGEKAMADLEARLSESVRKAESLSGALAKETDRANLAEKSLQEASGTIRADSKELDRLRTGLTELLASISPVPAPAPEPVRSEPESTDSRADEAAIVPEIVVEPPSRVSRTKGGPSAGGKKRDSSSPMADLESQLQKELSMVASAGGSVRDGIASVFKRRK